MPLLERGIGLPILPRRGLSMRRLRRRTEDLPSCIPDCATAELARKQEKGKQRAASCDRRFSQNSLSRLPYYWFVFRFVELISNHTYVKRCMTLKPKLWRGADPVVSLPSCTTDSPQPSTMESKAEACRLSTSRPSDAR